MQTMTTTQAQRDNAYAHGYASTIEKIENGATREAMCDLRDAARARKAETGIDDLNYWIFVGIATAVGVTFGD